MGNISLFFSSSFLKKYPVYTHFLVKICCTIHIRKFLGENIRILHFQFCLLFTVRFHWDANTLLFIGLLKGNVLSLLFFFSSRSANILIFAAENVSSYAQKSPFLQKQNILNINIEEIQAVPKQLPSKMLKTKLFKNFYFNIITFYNKHKTFAETNENKRKLHYFFFILYFIAYKH